MKIDNSYDLVIVGSGPAGMSAAIEAAKQKMKALVLDDQPSAGGQVYRHVMHNRNIKAGLSFLGKRGSLLLAVVSLEVQVNCMRCILPCCLIRPEN